MKTYRVFVHEHWVQTVEVEAKDPADARERVAKGMGTPLDNSLEYIEQLGDAADWTVEED